MGAWIETAVNFDAESQAMSHPVWVRGLKQVALNLQRNGGLSHPVWVRGLKLLVESQVISLPKVAPRVGAWIETCC